MLHVYKTMELNIQELSIIIPCLGSRDEAA